MEEEEEVREADKVMEAEEEEVEVLPPKTKETGWQGVLEQHKAVVEAERDAARRTADRRTRVDFESAGIRKIGSAKHLAGKDLLEL